MSDFNDGVDDYRSKNQMSGASAGYSQNGQSYGQQYGQSYSQPYGQPAQNHDQQMQQQPQFASPYGQPVQQQMNPQQMGQQQFAQSQMSQSYGRSVQPQMSQPQFGQPRMSQQPPYGQPPMGRPYGRSYGSPAFATRSGYANGRFNSSYIEEQARKFSFRWNAKEIISAIIVVVVAAIFSPVFECGFDLSFNISQIIEIIFNYHDEFYILEHVIYYMQYTFTLMIVLSFAQVLRKRLFLIACGLVVFVTEFLAFATYYILNLSHFEHIDSVVRIYFRDLFWQSSSIVIFMTLVELLQGVMTRYKAASFWKYILINFIAAVIGYIYYLVVTRLGIRNAHLNLPYLFSEYFLIEAEGFFIVAIPVLIILPCLVALLLKAVKFSKFLNPEREMMHL